MEWVHDLGRHTNVARILGSVGPRRWPNVRAGTFPLSGVRTVPGVVVG